MVKIINRGFRLAENATKSLKDPQSAKLDIKKKKPLWQPKTKIFVQQAFREQEDSKSDFIPLGLTNWSY